MSNSLILSEITTLFEPYVKAPQELYDIRVQIANYMESIKPQAEAQDVGIVSLTVPDSVTGIRRQYLKAIYKNIAIRQEYFNLRTKLQTASRIGTESSNPVNTVETHLELIKLQKQYQTYQTLSHYLKEAEKLAKQHRIYDVQPVEQPSSSNTLSPPDTSVLLSQIQEYTRRLNVSILRTHQQLKREKQLLEELESQTTGPTAVTPEARLRALLATNAELTRWIEESLAKCDVDNNEVVNGNATNHDEQEPIDYNVVINSKYEEYLEARKRLLDATAALTPLPSPSNPPQQRTVLNKSISNQPSTNLLVTPSVLPYIDSQYLPLHNQDLMLKHAQNHLDDLVAKHRKDLSEQLLRLSDESHLLPSYPILAKSKKTEEAFDEVDRLLSAWKFAIEAAGTATAAQVDKHVKIGERAVEESNVALEGIVETEEMWEKLYVK